MSNLRGAVSNPHGGLICFLPCWISEWTLMLISEWRFSVRHIGLRYRNNRCRCRMSDIADIRIDVDAHLWNEAIIAIKWSWTKDLEHFLCSWKICLATEERLWLLVWLHQSGRRLARVLFCHPAISTCVQLFVTDYHSWALASRKLTPASAFRHQ